MSYIGNQPTSVAFLTDQFSGTGSQTAFTLSAAPANTASILVAVSGVLQDPTTYSTSGLTLTFSAAPPSGTGNISVRYLGIPASNITTTAYSTRTDFTATAGQTTFTVPSYTVNFIQVYRNGVLLGSADYAATTGTTVVLTTAATAGDLVTTISFYVSSVLGAIPATNGAVTTPYILDGAVSQSKLGLNIAGTGPSFYAYASTNQTGVSSGTWTKVNLGSKSLDSNNNFASSRFTPTVAGWYMFNASVYCATSTNMTNARISFYQNGSQVLTGPIFYNASTDQIVNGSGMYYMNGTTDYMELYGIINGGSGAQFAGSGGSIYTFMQGFMVRNGA